MNPPKLLFLVTEDWYFVSHRLPLAVAARQAGYEVTVVTHLGEFGNTIRNAGLRLIPIELSRRGKNPFSEMMLVARLIAIYRRERPDIVHHVAMKPILYGSWAARIAGVPAVVNAFAGLGHAFSTESRRAMIFRFFLKHALKAALTLPHSRVIFQNVDDAEQLIRTDVVQSAQVTIIRGSGVDISMFSPSSEADGEPLVVLASRMLWNKGVGEFISAIRLLKEEEIRAKYVLVGMVDHENPGHIPETQLLQWQKDGLAEWWGYRKDMPQVLGAAHVVVLPTYYGEGLPKVLLEAAACARPIITTNTRGCSDIVRYEENGFLVPPKDPRALAQAIATLVRNPALRARMGARGREIVVSEFSVERIVRDTLALYRELLGNPSSSACEVSRA